MRLLSVMGGPMCSVLNCRIDDGSWYGHVKGQPIDYINGHYQRSRRRSSVDDVVDDITSCWVWQRVTLRGYGRMRVGRTMQYAHRVDYERSRGPIPAGLHLDHLRKNPACVNPAHLEPVTPRENALGGDTIAARRKARTHCVRGHPFDEANTIRVGAGRACRGCQRRAVRESQRKRRARLAGSGKPSPRKLIAGFRPIDFWVDPEAGCWVWQRYLGPEGYALERRDGKRMPAHRYYDELYKGPIRKGLLLDHLCRNRACVNPAHLEPVTAKENAARRAPRRRAVS